MEDESPRYLTARWVFVALELLGWVLVVLGIGWAVQDLLSGRTAGVLNSRLDPLSKLVFGFPGLLLVAVALIDVAAVQVSRAIVDTANSAREIAARLAEMPEPDHRATMDPPVRAGAKRATPTSSPKASLRAER